MNWRDARVLVTGAAGFLGSHLIYALHRLGAQVVSLVPNRTETHSLEQRGLLDKTDVWYGDLSDGRLLRTLVSKHEVNVCFHLAAFSQVRRSAANPSETFAANIEGTWLLLDACRRLPGFRAFVGASSDKAYGDHGGVPYREDMALRAVHTYDVSKACADLLMQSAAHQYDLPCVVTRCANIYGPGDFNWDRIVPNTLRRLHRGERPVIHEGASQYRRSFLAVSDCVNAYLRLASRANELKGEAFNVSNDESSVSVAELIGRLCEMRETKVEPETRPRERNFKEIPAQSLDSSKIRERVGWRPRVTLDQGLHDCVAWYGRMFETGKVPPLDPAMSVADLS
jgi:CDP-glucose 4,6-dehydratase